MSLIKPDQILINLILHAYTTPSHIKILVPDWFMVQTDPQIISLNEWMKGKQERM